MLNYIREKLSKLDVTVQEDGYGNIYVTKGEAKSYPCVVAHTDTVQDMLTNINIFRTEDTLFAFNPKDRRQWGIGGDDKVGVYITLQLLEDISVLKAVFFRDEEMGCRGSNYSIVNHLEWYKDCGFILMADRKGNSDVITVSGGIIITSPEFLEACDPIFDKYGYKDAVGIYSDIDTLTAGGIGISTVNFSCGYHEPHSSREVVSISDVNKCYNLMYDIIVEHGDKTFAYKTTIPKYKATYKPYGHYTARETLINEVLKVGISTPVGKRQLKCFPPLCFGSKPGEYDLFTEVDIIKGGHKIYAYKGAKALVLTGDSVCSKCKTSVVDNVYYLPYEGRMYCTKCNDYVKDDKVPALLKDLEVEDNGTVFVYSLYSVGWLHKDHVKWNPKISSWVSTQLPF
jgi:hypothetical protein